MYVLYLFIYVFAAAQIWAHPAPFPQDDVKLPENCADYTKCITDVEVWRRMLPELESGFLGEEIKKLNLGKRLDAIPVRPEGVNSQTFHASQFEQFDQIAGEYNFDFLNPAVQHAPVFLFGRTGPTVDPCYPEGALNNGWTGDGPNPGTGGSRGPASANPGADCTNPGDYSGAYSKGSPFPVYVSAAWCGDKGEWRINYDVYYVHDANLLAGHKHDWEGVTVVFKTDPNYPESNWYMAQSVIFNRHKYHDRWDWKDVQTVAGEEDVREEGFGQLRKHPKVYVGFFSHSAFRDKCDSGDGCVTVNHGEPTSKQEYRSNDWYRLVEGNDLFLYTTVHKDWEYGGTSTPWKNHDGMCGF